MRDSCLSCTHELTSLRNISRARCNAELWYVFTTQHDGGMQLFGCDVRVFVRMHEQLLGWVIDAAKAVHCNRMDLVNLDVRTMGSPNL